MASSKKPSDNKPHEVAYLSRWVGDYHAPRLLALQSALADRGQRLAVVQLGVGSQFYKHAQVRRNQLISKLDFTLRPCQSGKQEAWATWSELNRIRPCDILVLGYNDMISLVAAFWARSHGARIHFLSDSKVDDQPRSRLTETVKRLVLKMFDGALVAGNRHAAYFRELGFRGPIEVPYDVIDNAFFAARAKGYKRHAKSILSRILPSHYVLCVSRLVPRKRITLALDLFAASRLAELGFGFVLVGDGPDLSRVIKRAEALELTSSLYHCPNVPNHRMPALYSGATALILASEYDQWGLCVNEAMSCGVPAFVTQRCGVAGEIVTPGAGFIFSPEGLAEAAMELRRCALDPEWRTTLSISCLERMTTCDISDFAEAVVRLTREPKE